MAERGVERGGFGRGFGGRGGRGDRGRGGRRGGHREEEEKWVLVTKLDRLVKEGKIKSLEQIYLHSLPVKEGAPNHRPPSPGLRANAAFILHWMSETLIFSAFRHCSTYEVVTACALALGAGKLICIVYGPILDESGRLVRFMTLQDADLLIRKRAKQSEIAANYVKAVTEEDSARLDYPNSNGTSLFVCNTGEVEDTKMYDKTRKPIQCLCAPDSVVT